MLNGENLVRIWHGFDEQEHQEAFKRCEDLLRGIFEGLSRSGKGEFEGIRHVTTWSVEGAELLVASPAALERETRRKSLSRIMPLLLLLDDDKWDARVFKILSNLRCELRGLFRFSRLGESRDPEEFASFVAVVKEVLREILRRRPGAHEEDFSKPADWKAKIEPSQAGFISLFSDPSMREMSRQFKEAIQGLKGRLPLKEAQRIPSLLLLGETGCGKSLLAQTVYRELFGVEPPKTPIQQESDEKTPISTTPCFTRLNISAYTKDLIDVELFGALKGAYTDCYEDRLGAFAESNRGVVFLDEIGDMPPELQTRLLTYMDDGRVTPRGSSASRHAPCFLVAATNRPVNDPDRRGGFREDLLHRFDSVVTIPPLRERRADLRLLVSLTLQDGEVNPGRRVERISLDVIAYLERRCFPGNFREFRSVLKQGVSNAVRSGSPCLCLRHLIF